MKRKVETNRGLKFGVEIEVCGLGRTQLAQNKIVNGLEAVGVRARVESYNHSVSRLWKVTTDASVQSGIEIVSPVLRDFDELEKVCAVLMGLERDGFIEVNVNCGVHVHHDVSDFGVKDFGNAFALYEKYENAIDKIMPRSRRENNNRWCQSIVNRNISKVFRNANTVSEAIREMGIGSYRSSARYVKLNICSYIQHGTLEFRHHSGTVNFEKIYNWVMLTHKIVEVSKEVKQVKATTEKRKAKWSESDIHMYYDLYKELGINATDLSDYIKVRKRELA